VATDPTQQAKYWAVPREWPGETAFLLGGGPSLIGFDAEVLRGRRVIAINNSYLSAPWADVLYFCDAKWWSSHRLAWIDPKGVEQPGALEFFTGRHRISLGTSEDGTKRLYSTGPRGLELKPNGLKHGSNSGYQAINLAVLFGAARIVLLGYDMRISVTPEGEKRSHWHAGHPKTTPDMQQTALQKIFLPRFNALVEPLKAAGVEVLNATPGSALKCWPMVALDEVLNPVAV
jgi:hypothetical protein